MIQIDWASVYAMDAWPVVPHWIDRLGRLYQRRATLARHLIDPEAVNDLREVDRVILRLECAIHTLVYGATAGPAGRGE